MRKFQNLEIWHKSHKLALDIYEITRKQFPKDELYALTSQIRRASASIPTNIAEGCGRKTNQEFVRFLHIASGSATEVEYQLLLAKDLQYIAPTTYEDLNRKIVEIRKMIISFIKKIPNEKNTLPDSSLTFSQHESQASCLEPGA